MPHDKTNQPPAGAPHEDDVVLSTRVRLARNLRDFPFPARLSAEGRQKVAAQVRAAAAAAEDAIGPLQWIDMARLPRVKAISMAERRVISAEFACQSPQSALLLRNDEALSIMLCEEDHLRIQALCPGLALSAAFALADAADTALGKHLAYAFDDHLGYLTQCPTNLGTAMRASVLLHLPALAALGRVARLSESISKLGLTIRGAFGEGSDAEGALFQLSNQVTLGITESQALENLQALTLQIAEQERRARADALKDPQWENKVWRAYGILKYARFLESGDALKLLSYVRMGAAGGLLPVSPAVVSTLMTALQPATLALSRAADDPATRDLARAEMIREALS
ncbi:MAG: ATP--guanido phosphotransferase [Oscillospiraceae bacterium]|jgi:protein arginine kinase|nr:ATP--guanido phosphotransferase [Oscillospiraceae bacterium]